MPYVYTNPPRDTEIFLCDRVFVLSQYPVKAYRTDPSVAEIERERENHGGGVTGSGGLSMLGLSEKETTDLQTYTAQRIHKKTAEDVLLALNTVVEEVRGYAVNHKLLEHKLSVLQSDCLQNIQAIQALAVANSVLSSSNSNASSARPSFNENVNHSRHTTVMSKSRAVSPQRLSSAPAPRTNFRSPIGPNRSPALNSNQKEREREKERARERKHRESAPASLSLANN
jgi:hypothetical protein